MSLPNLLKQAAIVKKEDRQYLTIPVPLPLLLKLIDGVRPEQDIIDARKGIK